MTDALAVIHKWGRPTKYTPELPLQVVELMSQGYGLLETASKLFISVETFYDWSDPDSARFKPEFSEALRMGEQLSRAWWAEQGIKGLRDRDFNVSVWIFNMKNRVGWRDSVDLTSDGKPISFMNSVPRPVIDQ